MPNDQIVSGLVEPQGLGEDPFYHFTCVFLAYLQGLFEAMPSGSYQWNEDEKASQIAITDQVPIPRTRVEQKPAIITMRGPGQFANLSLDQVRTVDSRTGMKERTDLVSCTMTINCIAKNGVEAQRIAWIVMRHIRQGKTLLQRAGMHKVGDEVQIGPESPPGSMISGEVDPEMVMISVYVPFFFQWTERDTPLDAITMKSAESRLRSALLPLSSTSTQERVTTRSVLRSPSIRGRVINNTQVSHQRLGEITQIVKT